MKWSYIFVCMYVWWLDVEFLPFRWCLHLHDIILIRFLSNAIVTYGKTVAQIISENIKLNEMQSLIDRFVRNIKNVCVNELWVDYWIILSKLTLINSNELYSFIHAFIRWVVWGWKKCWLRHQLYNVLKMMNILKNLFARIVVFFISK